MHGIRQHATKDDNFYRDYDRLYEMCGYAGLSQLWGEDVDTRDEDVASDVQQAISEELSL